MPSESFKNLEKGFEVWNRRDTDAVLELLSEDIVWMTGRALPGIGLRYEGHEGVRRFFHVYRYDERHLCREFRAYAEDDREDAMREAGRR